MHGSVWMRLGVYASCRPGNPLVLVPDCMLPPAEAERRHGPLVYRGEFDIDDCADTIDMVAIINAVETDLFATVHDGQTARLLDRMRRQLMATS